MHKRYLVPVICALLGLTLMLSLTLTSGGAPVQAQGGSTPAPDVEDDPLTSRERYATFYDTPASSEGDAAWAIALHTFESQYPDGFKFTVDATSTGGDIESATVYWSHVPGEQRRLAAEHDPNSGLFVADWQIDETLPPWVAVNYHWRFTDDQGNTYRSQWFTGEEYADNSRPWSRFESEDIIVFLQAGLDRQAATETFNAMEAQRATFEQAWGGPLSYKPRVMLFNTFEAFNEWRLRFQSRSDVTIIGQTSGSWGATVQVVTRGDIYDLAYGTVLHEIAHLYQADFTPRAGLSGVTGWWTEGQATFFELNQQYDYEDRVRAMARNGQLTPLFDGAGPNPGGTGPDGRVRFGYDVGYTFFVWLVDNYGLDGHRQVIDALRRGATRDEALEAATGLTVQEIESAWRVWLGASADVPALIPTPTIEFRFPPTPTPYQFN